MFSPAKIHGLICVHINTESCVPHTKVIHPQGQTIKGGKLTHGMATDSRQLTLQEQAW